MRLSDAHRDDQRDDVGLLVVLVPAQLNGQHVRLAQSREDKLPITGAVHRPRVEGIDESRARDRCILKGVLDRAVDEAVEVNSLRNLREHVRVILEGFVVGLVAPVGADVGEGFNDFKDAALQVSRGKFRPLCGGFGP